MVLDWYKDAVIYQLNVRTFFDSNDDGVGDFEGLRSKLPYLRDLGVNALWLLPFYSSPLRDDGYDIADYCSVQPELGSVDDFRRLLDDAHAAGLRIVTEIVCNHTSDRHPWFRESRRPGSEKRDWYVWSDDPSRFSEARVIFGDTETSNWTWDPEAGAYYWHRFFSHQPDLNWDNPAVEEAIVETLFHWLDLGVDAIRLDGVPYLYEREGTDGENLPETVAAVKRLRRRVDERYGGAKVLLADVNGWPEETLPYFGDGEGVHMAFNFPIMPRLFLALRRGSRRPIAEMLKLTADIPETAQWALFLRNHDELTLQMVTDEERDVLVREYAADPRFRLNQGIRRRLAPLLGNERRRIELLNGLLLSLKGSPVIYYGDELGMGDNIFLGDRGGVRTPMQWSADRNAGFSRAPQHRLALPPVAEGPYRYELVNVEAERQDPHSLLNFMRRLLGLRRRYGEVFGRGELHLLEVANPAVLAFLRSWGERTVLVVANLSRFAQAVDLELDDFAGVRPVELFGRAPFPPIGEGGYRLTLGPHGFFWFALAGEEDRLDLKPPPLRARQSEDTLERELPTLELQGGLEGVLIDTLVQGPAREGLEVALPGYLSVQRWFGAKERPLASARLEDAVRLQAEPFAAYLATLEVAFEDGGAERYFLPLAVAEGEEAEALWRERPRAAVAWLQAPDGDRCLLHDATASPGFWTALYGAVRRRWRGRSVRGSYSAEPFPGTELPASASARVLGVEQSNSSAVLAGAAFGKLYRKVAAAPNAEAEMLDYLTSSGFPFVPRLKGGLRFRRGDSETTLGVFQEYLAGEGDAWAYTLGGFDRFLGRPAGSGEGEGLLPSPGVEAPPDWLEEAAPEVLGLARLLGVRSAQMHAVLSRAQGTPLAPEPTEPEELAALAERVRSEAARTQELLRGRGIELDEELLSGGLRRLARLEEASGGWLRIRIHGDYHLGQVLQAGGEFYILDFEGEPGRSPEERRAKEQALRDVAGMLRSWDYAGLVAGRAADELGRRRAAALARWCERVFLDAYLATAGPRASFLPDDEGLRELLLWSYSLDKVLYEVRYELGSRPDWVELPLSGLERLLRAGLIGER